MPRFHTGLRIRTPVLKPVWQALHWLRHLPCPSLIVFCDSDKHFFFFFYHECCFCWTICQSFSGSAQDFNSAAPLGATLIQSSEHFIYFKEHFLKGLLHFVLGSAVPKVTEWIMSCLCPAKAQFVSTVLKYIPGMGASEFLLLCTNITTYWHSIFKLTQILNNFMISQAWFYMRA